MTFRFVAGSNELVGTLSMPEGTGPFPAVLLINGSGPLDRDSNIPGQALHIADTFAASFAAAGLASLRYDKRGVGASSGDYLATGFHDEVEDARSALRALADHPDIDPTRLVVLGHSVGATIAARLAATEPVAGCVLLAAAAMDGGSVMRQQSETIAATMTGIGRFRRASFLRAQAAGRRALQQSVGESMTLDGATVPARWFREYMAHDPRDDFARLTCPVLALTGANDIQVEPGDVAEICRVVRGPSTALTPPGITHLLREGKRRLSDYARTLSEPLDGELVGEVTRWCADVTRDDAE